MVKAYRIAAQMRSILGKKITETKINPWVILTRKLVLKLQFGIAYKTYSTLVYPA